MKKPLFASFWIASLLYGGAMDDQTNVYKEQWFDKAKTSWNQEHTDNPYNFDYYTYHFPDNADFDAGTPPDDPILPSKWMLNASVGLTKKIDLGDESSIYQYDTTKVAHLITTSERWGTITSWQKSPKLFTSPTPHGSLSSNPMVSVVVVE